ncbi:MAG: tetratricopeptide repeat protein [Chloroflexota bacterium]|nr:tetratricopeptide repeat protein [Chloroflexota bacterium]
MTRTTAKLGLAVLLVILSILSCQLPGAEPPGPTATPSHTPTPTATSTPTPTPTPLPMTMIENAERARFNGDWERAINIYQEAQSFTSDPSLSAAAQLGIGKTLLEASRYEEAVAALDEYLLKFPDHDGVAEATFLRADGKMALGRYAEAAEDYGDSINLGLHTLDAYVLELQGDAWIAAGENERAQDAYSIALQTLSPETDISIEIKLARAIAASGNYSLAIEHYESIYARTENEYTRALINLLTGQAYLTLGEAEQAYQRFLDSVENFPRAYDSYSGLVTLVNNGVPVNELDRGLVDYYAGQYSVAIAAFDRYLTSGLEAQDGTAHYFKALSLRMLGDYAGALQEWQILIDTYPNDPYFSQAWDERVDTLWAYLDQYDLAAQTSLAFAQNYPEHPQASEFLFAAARIAERNNDLEQSAQLWLQLSTDYPNAPEAFRAAFLAGIQHFRLGENNQAETAFERALELSLSSEDRAAAQLWIGKSRQASGDIDAAQQAFRAAEAADPNGYYSLRAADILKGRSPFQAQGVFIFPSDDEIALARDDANQWMRETFGITSTVPLTELDENLRSDPRAQRGEKLWRLGRYGEAKAEFESLRKDYLHNAEATYRLMNWFLDLGLYQPAIYNVREVIRLAGLDEANSHLTPDYLRYVRFGPYFGELFMPEALSQGMDGLFLLSVSRQESLFESFATSYAAARGLMQIIPSTGEYVAAREGWPPGYTADDLYRPIVSVRLGASYLADQRDLFNGDLYAALAAYNAGPGNSSIWKELSQEDPDLFLEIIRLQQPQDYIRSIAWAFAEYQALYTVDD